MTFFQKAIGNPVPLRNYLLILVISFSLASYVTSSASCPKDPSPGDDCASSDTSSADSTDLQSGGSITSWIKDSFSTPPLHDPSSSDSKPDGVSSLSTEESSDTLPEADSITLLENEVGAMPKSEISDTEPSSDSDSLPVDVDSLPMDVLSDTQESSEPASFYMDEKDSLLTEDLSATPPHVDPATTTSQDDDVFYALIEKLARKPSRDSFTFRKDEMPNFKTGDSPVTPISIDSVFQQEKVDNLSTEESPGVSTLESVIFEKSEMDNLSTKQSSVTQLSSESIVFQQDENEELETKESPDTPASNKSIFKDDKLNAKSPDILASKDSVVYENDEMDSLSTHSSNSVPLSEPATFHSDENDSLLTKDSSATSIRSDSITAHSPDDSFYSSLSKLAETPPVVFQENEIDNLSIEKSLDAPSSDYVTLTEDDSISSTQTDTTRNSDSEQDDNSVFSIEFSITRSESNSITSNFNDHLDTSSTKESSSSHRQEKSEDVLPEECKKVRDLPFTDELQDPCQAIATKGIKKEDILDDGPKIVLDVYKYFLEHVEKLKCNAATMLRENLLKSCTELRLPPMEKIPTPQELELLQPAEALSVFYASMLNHTAHAYFLLHQASKYDYACSSGLSTDIRPPATSLARNSRLVACFIKFFLLSAYDHFEDEHFLRATRDVMESVMCEENRCSRRHLQACQIVMSVDTVLTRLVKYVEMNVLKDGLNLPLRPGIAERCRAVINAP